MDSPKGDYTRWKRQVFSHLKKVKTLISDSPKGDYTRWKGLVFPTDIRPCHGCHVTGGGGEGGRVDACQPFWNKKWAQGLRVWIHLIQSRVEGLQPGGEFHETPD